MKQIAFFSLLFLPLLISAAEIKLTEGLWYFSVPDNKGTITATDAAIRFIPGGTAELVYSERAKKAQEKLRKTYKERVGKDLPEMKFSWSLKGKELSVTVVNPVLKRKKPEIYIISDDPMILMPKNQQQFILLARKGAKFSPEQAKKFWKQLSEANRDKFADNLKLPENIKLFTPEKEKCYFHFFRKTHWKDTPGDSFQKYVLSAINKGEKLSDDAVCSLPSLEKMMSDKHAKEILLQYFACHPEWRLYPEPNRGLHAVRYFRYPDGSIAPTLHQYYSHFLPTDMKGEKVGDPALEFQFRFDIGLDGNAWNSSLLHPRDKTERKGNDWNTRFRCGTALVDLYDQSKFPGRQMTKAALDFTEKEFAALHANLKKWKKLLPKDSVRKGKPELILWDSIQGGIYDAALWCNPGEKGVVYLKAYEITKGTPLSVQRLKNTSSGIPGWSDDPNELFVSHMHFTIYEGEWNQFYGARFEVWFKPDSGKPERKLFEKNFKIQGWSR